MRKIKNDIISREEAVRAIMGEPTDAHYPDWYAEKIRSLPSIKYRFSKWKKLDGNYMTPGGTPTYVCGNCGGSQHLYGVEFSRRKIICDDCGYINIYPWEKSYEEKEKRIKTKEEIQKTCIGDVFTLEEFAEEVCDGGINSYDGNGYFHDGENETCISVWRDDLTMGEIKKYPYVCWYNK